jgi:hypothetical protein
MNNLSTPAKMKNVVSVATLPRVLYSPVNHYLEYKNTLATNDPSEGKSIHFPINIDTEFVSTPLHWSETTIDINGRKVNRKTRQSDRLHITTQIRAIGQKEGVIFASRECADKLPRHKPLTTGFDPVDYLIHLGYDARLRKHQLESSTRAEKNAFNKLPEFRFVLFAHFAPAELMLIVRDDYWTDFDKLVSTPDDSGKPRFSMKRRLQAITEIVTKQGGKFTKNTVDVGWTLHLQGRLFRVLIEWVDTCALHGMSSYKAICEASRVKLDYKDNFSSEEKSRMLDMAIDRPKDFDDYALGDLYVFDALVGNAENFKTVYQALGVAEYYKEPALTIGATIKNLFEAKLAKNLGLNYHDKDQMEFLRSNFLTVASAKYLRQSVETTRCLLAKVEGGRCTNNRPDVVQLESELCDIDFAGCYAEGLRYQPYPIGKPEYVVYPSDERSEFWTLAEFRKTLGSELVPGLWCARVWSKEKLEYGQDFLSSWFVPSVGDDLLKLGKYVVNLANDTENAEIDDHPEFDLEDGNLKIFSNEIVNGIITSEFLDWLDHVASKRQKKELESKLFVKAAMYYSREQEIKEGTSEEKFAKLVQGFSEHTRGHKVKRVGRKGNKRNLNEDGQFHGWFSVTIGDLIINDLLMWRKFYQKTEGKKQPLDLCFKLCCNTLYGDMTSKFFDCANTVVGNCVTARARAVVWYSEKGLNALQSITDGGGFELNRVAYPTSKRFRINGENVVDLYALDERDINRSRNLRFAPLGGSERIYFKEWVEKDYNGKKYHEPLVAIVKDGIEQVLELKDAERWVNVTAMEHLQTQFANVAVLHSPTQKLDVQIVDGKPVKVFSDRKGMFSYEMKGFFTGGAFHGSANYLLLSPAGNITKMRSYETNKAHESIGVERRFVEELNEYIPHPVITERYGLKNNPAVDFLNGLLGGHGLDRQVTFVKTRIVKPNDYKNKYAKYRRLGLTVGDNYLVSGLLREFSLSQFRFRTMDQFVAWEKKITNLKDRYGQSIERYFIDDDGNLDYPRMVSTVLEMIKDGNTRPIETLDPRWNQSRPGKSDHPSFEAFIAIRNLLDQGVDD